MLFSFYLQSINNFALIVNILQNMYDHMHWCYENIKIVNWYQNWIPMCKRCLSISIKVTIFTVQFLVTFEIERPFCSPWTPRTALFIKCSYKASSKKFSFVEDHSKYMYEYWDPHSRFILFRRNMYSQIWSRVLLIICRLSHIKHL